MRTLTLTRPDDWHVHFRDHDSLAYTAEASARHFSRALVMPNLIPPLTRVDAITAYQQRILSALKRPSSFTPYFSLYLTESLAPDELYLAQNNPHILGAKLYPAGATTNSEQGIRSIRALYPLLDVMQSLDLVLQIHGEVTHSDIFCREALFLTEVLLPLIDDFPKLRIILEHISTKAAVDFVMNAPERVAATITPHHLRYNRNHLLAGGIKPHYYCLPILKKEPDQQALQSAATSGKFKFFAGTDSAPHTRSNKENACGCAGIYSAPFALSFYTQLFDEMDKLACLNDFLSRAGATFYRLPISEARIELIERPFTVPPVLSYGQDQIVPIGAGETLNWQVNESA